MTEITKCELLVMEVIWRNQESGAEEMSLPMVMEKLKKNYGFHMETADGFYLFKPAREERLLGYVSC